MGPGLASTSPQHIIRTEDAIQTKHKIGLLSSLQNWNDIKINVD